MGMNVRFKFGFISYIGFYTYIVRSEGYFHVVVIHIFLRGLIRTIINQNAEFTILKGLDFLCQRYIKSNWYNKLGKISCNVHCNDSF